jgi:hypothetical protein
MKQEKRIMPMVTRILRWIFLGGLLVVLVWGGANRTLAITGDSNGQTQPADGYGTRASGVGQTVIRAGDWTMAEGTVARVDGHAMLIDTDSHGRLVIEGQSWTYAQSQEFTAQAGDRIAVTGFDEAGEFKTGQLHNKTTGQQVLLRDEAGWPYWSMRYQRQQSNH